MGRKKERELIEKKGIIEKVDWSVGWLMGYGKA